MLRRVGAVAAVTAGLLLPFLARAATYDIAIQRSDVTFRPERFFVGDLVRVYATVKNVGEKDVQGNVFFSENGTAIGTPPPFSVRARGAEEEVWVDWQPVTTGDRQIFIRIVTAPETRDEDQSNNETIVPVFIDRDSDRDGIGDRDEPPPTVQPSAVRPQPFAAIVSASPPSPAATLPTPRPKGPTPSHSPSPDAPAGVGRGEGEKKSSFPTSLREGGQGGVGTSVASSPPTTAPAPTHAAPSPEPAAHRIPYDTQLRDLLGGPATRWRLILPPIAGGIAVIALAALAAIVIRRRRTPHAPVPSDTSTEDVGRRPRRTS